eukprot:CAMPEP_0113934478 /NCGR_PEP_ID=MMETSP1339-20121228/1803_1 /TAXON_ID=94617 /ORGANISM="Fibrocapsa japonica" /LENGTH=389 /DNA_ID=CAMNT_0000936297 /DNA_START=53 /DNA_END=1222 /DNA_ORIENTATION=+ /assembly_acc=CAM_ASM_000762
MGLTSSKKKPVQVGTGDKTQKLEGEGAEISTIEVRAASGTAAPAGNGSKQNSRPNSDGGFEDHYTRGKELGSGAYSHVFLCNDKSTRQQYAVKVVQKSKLAKEDLDALNDEIAIMQELDHEHIIKLVRVFETRTHTRLVLELVQGGELFDRIVKKSQYTEKEARDLVKILLRTLAYMHGKDVVHRDLKPENLLMTHDDDDADIKICDFGFARHISEVKAMEEACGTPNYVAPEILRGLQYSGKCDVWSCGVITYILLGGYPPFYDEDQDQLFKKIRRGTYEFHQPYWDHISSEAKDLINKMLVVNHKQRQSAQELLQHPWICAHDDHLHARDITQTLEEFRKFNAKRKLKGAIRGVLALNRLQSALGTNSSVGSRPSSAASQQRNMSVS